MQEINFNIPVKTVSESNLREHWTQRKKRSDTQKLATLCQMIKIKDNITFPCTVILTRIGKRKLDTDNLPISLKHVRDEIANHLIPGLKPGQADGDSRICWIYQQKTDKNYSIDVKIIYNNENYNCKNCGGNLILCADPLNRIENYWICEKCLTID